MSLMLMLMLMLILILMLMLPLMLPLQASPRRVAVSILAASMLLCAAAGLRAADRLTIAPAALELGTAPQRVFVRCDNDRPLGGVSLLVGFDPAALRILAIEVADVERPGSWLPPLPSERVEAANARGQVSHYEVFGLRPDATPPFDPERVLPPGAGQDILRITVQVLATRPATTGVDFLDRDPFFPHPQDGIAWNVLSRVGERGEPISIVPPALGLEGRRIQLLAGPPAEVVARALRLNDRVESAFDGGGGDDWFALDALAATTLDVRLAPRGRSDGALEVRVYRSDGEEIAAAASPPGRKLRLARLALPATDTYFLLVRGDAGSPAAWRLDLRGRLAPEERLDRDSGTLTSRNPNFLVTFDALPGSELTAMLSTSVGNLIIVGMDAPGGIGLPLEPPHYRPGDRVERLRRLALPTFGTYAMAVSVDLEGAPSGDVDVVLKTRLGKRRKLPDPGALPAVPVAFLAE